MSDPFQEAYAAHRSGRWPAAESAYQALLHRHPDHADGLHFFGLLRHQQGRHQEAAELIGRALEHAPALAGAWLNLGNAQKALGRIDEACASYRLAIEQQPDFAAAHANLGNALSGAGRDHEAVAAYRRALALEPDNVSTLNNLGNALAKLDQLDEAIRAFERALALAPRHAGALNNLGNTRKAQGQLAQAIEHFEAALALQPDFALAWFNLGHTLDAMARCADAAAAFERALALQPEWHAARYALANALAALGHSADARAHFETVLKREPEFALAWQDMGSALYDMGEFDAARNAFERALALRPELAIAAYNRALVQLLQGDLRAGLAGYEMRHRVFDPGTPLPDAPLWLGETPLSGRTILVYAEQGLGDTVQFVRYVAPLARRAARVVLEVQAELAPLLAPAAQRWGVTMLVRGTARPQVDCRCPLPSLPLAFNTQLQTIPAPAAYLAPPAESLARWQNAMRQHGTPRIGLVWSGRVKARRENRAIGLAALAPFWQIPGCEWILLQKDVAEHDRAAWTQALELPHVHAPPQALQDFADTAALIATLDCVITIDTSVAHVAAALGKPTWVMLPHAPDWRWLLQREDSPWYPSMRLFRQPSQGDWDSVVESVSSALRDALPSLRASR